MQNHDQTEPRIALWTRGVDGPVAVLYFLVFKYQMDCKTVDLFLAYPSSAAAKTLKKTNMVLTAFGPAQPQSHMGNVVHRHRFKYYFFYF